MTFGPGRGTAGGCFVTPCQGVFLIRSVSCGLVSVPGTVEVPARPLIFSFGSGVTFGPGTGAAGGCFVTPCQGTLQIRKTPWHGVTKQPPAVPLPGPNVTPEPNENINGLAGNCSRQTKKATRHPSNQENTLARRDETASCRPCARAKRHS